MILWRFDHIAGSDTGSADHNFSDLSVANRTHSLKIGIETAVVDIMGMTDMAACQRAFATDFTHFGHIYCSLLE
jgi:hypothetical protein